MGYDIEYYTDGAGKCVKRLMRQLTAGDIGVIELVSFLFGMLAASCFPRLTKKLRPLLILISIIAMAPLLIKMVHIVLDVFKIKVKFKR